MITDQTDVTVLHAEFFETVYGNFKCIAVDATIVVNGKELDILGNKHFNSWMFAERPRFEKAQLKVLDRKLNELFSGK